LGVALIVIGLIVLAVTYSILPPWIYRLWPLILVAIGVFGLVSKPGWLDELDHAVPGLRGYVNRPRRIVSLVLIAAGLIMLAFSFHVVDERVTGPLILITLGLLLIWRRQR
jgi:hypothetical protein